jgi:hypothetical protein
VTPAPRWDVYTDKRAEDQLTLGSEAGLHALQRVLEDLRDHGPQIIGARPYPPPFPSILWRAPIVLATGPVYGAIEYVEELHQRIRVTWVAWLPNR